MKYFLIFLIFSSFALGQEFLDLNKFNQSIDVENKLSAKFNTFQDIEINGKASILKNGDKLVINGNGTDISFTNPECNCKFNAYLENNQSIVINGSSIKIENGSSVNIPVEDKLYQFKGVENFSFDFKENKFSFNRCKETCIVPMYSTPLRLKTENKVSSELINEKEKIKLNDQLEITLYSYNEKAVVDTTDIEKRPKVKNLKTYMREREAFHKAKVEESFQFEHFVKPELEKIKSKYPKEQGLLQKAFLFVMKKQIPGAGFLISVGSSDKINIVDTTLGAASFFPETEKTARLLGYGRAVNNDITNIVPILTAEYATRNKKVPRKVVNRVGSEVQKMLKKSSARKQDENFKALR